MLVVDDSPDTLRMLTDALEDAGMTVLVALEGRQALAIGEKIAPDIILLDGDPLEGYWNWLKTKLVVKGGVVVVDKL